MSVLLAADQVALYQPGPLDEHGWRAAPEDWVPLWCGLGNLQLEAGRSDPGAMQGGGAGPYEPLAVAAGTLYLPPEAEPAEGAAAVVRGQLYALSQVRYLADPAAGGDLDCWAATVTEGPRG